MRILIITNPEIEEFIEDKWIAEAFVADGHEVKIVNKNYNESLENEFDIFLKRNCWSTDESDFVVGKDSDGFKKRLVNKNLHRINCDGKFDGSGKQYLCDLFKKDYEVIPSVNSPKLIKNLPQCEYYLLKPQNGLDGFGIEKVRKSEIYDKWNNNYIIQPLLEFGSEVQFYFVGNKFEYALEFTPSKVPDYPDPTIYNYKEKELILAQKFADMSPNYNGVQRIDFLRLKNNELKLLEIEDSSPYLDLESVSDEMREQFITDYKNMVYKYCKIKF